MPSDRRLAAPNFSQTCLAGLIRDCTAVDERMEPQAATRWRRFDQLVLIHTRAGEATWTTTTDVLRLLPGTLLAVAPGTRHRQQVGSRWWHAGYLMLRGPWLDEVITALAPHGGGFVFADQAGLGRADLDRTLAAAFNGQDAWAWQFAAGLGGLIARLLHHTAVDAPDAQLAERLRRLVDGDPAAPWEVAALARALALSTSALAHRCTAELGISPAAWVRRRKAALARELLVAGLSVTAASERLGFANPYHFSRVIRSELGVPPSHLRRPVAPSPLN